MCSSINHKLYNISISSSLSFDVIYVILIFGNLFFIYFKDGITHIQKYHNHIDENSNKKFIFELLFNKYHLLIISSKKYFFQKKEAINRSLLLSIFNFQSKLIFLIQFILNYLKYLIELNINCQ